ncbi:hypothetical protein BKI52_21665 [marine bacterium AO1-C]|nr:hypothetical protein BKI52_21665 [marine bacterium AO1-C]
MLMKLPTTYSEQETTANELWGQFTQNNEEVFWQQYESLIELQAAKIVYTNLPKISTISPQVFHYLMFPYRTRLNFFLAIMTVIGLFSFQIYTDPSFLESFVQIAIIVSLLLMAKHLWVFSIYDINDRRLTITRNLSLKSTFFEWERIRAMTIYKNGLGKNAETQLSILLITNKVHYFKYPLFGNDHLTFLKILGQKKIDVDSKI